MRSARKYPVAKFFDGRTSTGTFLILLMMMVCLISGCGFGTYERVELETEPLIRIEAETEKAETLVISEDGEGSNKAGAGAGDVGTAEAADASGLAADAGTAGAQTGGTLLFGGDVLLSDHVLQAYEKAGGISGVLDAEYRNAIAQADFFMVNEEFPFSSRGVQAEDKQYTFRLAPERVAIFQEMGIGGVTLANNHALDYGEEALLDSCETLDQAGILHTGAGANLEEASRPVYLESGGRSIAVIGATRVVPESSWIAGRSHAGMLSSYDATVLLQEIRELKQEGNLVIVYVHWGVERSEQPEEYQRTLARQYIDAGADLVIGSHPHVLQGLEYYKGKPIVYSLGNFVFGSSIPRTMLLEVSMPGAETADPEPEDREAEAASRQAGMAASEAEARESETAAPELRLRLLPGTSGAGYTRQITDSEQRQAFYDYMEGISFGVRLSEDGVVLPH